MSGDFRLVSHGSLCVLTPLTDAGVEWIDEHIPEDVQRWGQSGVVIEPRYVDPIVEGILNDGLDI